MIEVGDFKRRAKRLGKKYLSLPEDIKKLSEELKANPTAGTPLGMNCYKVRLKISSKNTGKSGGARVITHALVIDNIVYLLTIYDKSEQNTVTDKQIKGLIESADFTS